MLWVRQGRRLGVRKEKLVENLPLEDLPLIDLSGLGKGSLPWRRSWAG